MLRILQFLKEVLAYFEAFWYRLHRWRCVLSELTHREGGSSARAPVLILDALRRLWHRWRGVLSELTQRKGGNSVQVPFLVRDAPLARRCGTAGAACPSLSAMHRWRGAAEPLARRAFRPCAVMA